MMFCLDDGAELLYGPAKSEPGAPSVAVAGFLPSDEPATAILHSTAAPGEAPTRAQIHMTDQTALFPAGTEAEPQKNLGDSSEKHRFWHKERASVAEAGNRSARRMAKPLIALIVAVVILVSGFFGYRYFAPTKQINSIAVMPFVNDSGNPDVEYLSDGMTETLIRSLSQLPNLNVKARSSVFRYKGKDTDARTIGKELGVQAILNGRVIQRGDQLSLSLELIDAQTENVIWTDQYDRKSSDLVSLQNDIARDVSSKLKTKLSGAYQQKLAKKYTDDPEAYRLYLQGRFYWNKRAGKEFEKSADYFRRAIEKDPNFALGYVGLADYYGDRERDKAKENVNRALALDDNLAEAHGTLGYQYMLDYNFAAAERHMIRGIEIDPKNLELHRWNGQRLMMLGRFDEAFASYKRALEIDPNSSPVHFIYGSCLIASGQLDKGIEYLENAIKADPTFVWNHSQLSFGYRFKNNYAGAVEERAKSQTKSLSREPDSSFPRKLSSVQDSC